MIKDWKWLVVIAWLSSGVWAGFAREYAEQWYDLLLIARNKKKTDTFIKYLHILYPNIKISYKIFDVSKKNELNELEKEIINIKNIKKIINCLAYTSHKETIKNKRKKWEDLITLHDLAAIHISQIAVKIMKREKQWSIIHVSSLSSLFAIANDPISATSKIFLNDFSNTFNQIHNKNIYIQTLCPKFTDTYFKKQKQQTFKDKALCVHKIIKKSILCSKKWFILCVPKFTNKTILTIYNILPKTWSYKIFKLFLN